MDIIPFGDIDNVRFGDDDIVRFGDAGNVLFGDDDNIWFGDDDNVLFEDINIVPIWYCFYWINKSKARKKGDYEYGGNIFESIDKNYK